MKTLIRDWAVVVMLAIVALVGLGKVGEDVFAHETASFDGAVQAWALAHQAAVLTPVFVFITTIGGVASMCIIALVGALFLAVRGHRRAAAGTLVAPAVAVVLSTLVKYVYARRRPVGLGGTVPSSYVFPSGMPPDLPRCVAPWRTCAGAKDTSVARRRSRSRSFLRSSSGRAASI